MHGRRKAERRARHADRHAKVTRRSYRDAVLAKERPARIAGEHAVIAAFLEQAVTQRELLRLEKHLVDAAARLDRTGNRQMTVLLEQQTRGRIDAVAPARGVGECGHGRQRRFDDASRVADVVEDLSEQRRKALQTRARIGDMRCVEWNVVEGDRKWRHSRIEPLDGLERHERTQERIVAQPRIEWLVVDGIDHVRVRRRKKMNLKTPGHQARADA
ncbi:MAG TPA: hypothetical protein VF573_01175 [Paraburkholderia sp.]